MGSQRWWRRPLNRSSSKLNWIQRSKTQRRVHFTTKKLRSSVKSIHDLRAHLTPQYHITTRDWKSRLRHRQQPRQLGRAVLPFATWRLHTRYFMMVSWCHPWCRADLTRRHPERRRNWSQAICPPSVTGCTQNMTQEKAASSPWHKVCRTTSVSTSVLLTN